MFQNLDEIQKIGQDNVDRTVRSFSAVSQGLQAIAAEAADYSKKSFEHGSATLEKLVGVQSVEKIVEVQTDYLKEAYEGLVAQATKMGSLFTDLTKEAYKPYETVLGRPGAKR